MNNLENTKIQNLTDFFACKLDTKYVLHMSKLWERLLGEMRYFLFCKHNNFINL